MKDFDIKEMLYKRRTSLIIWLVGILIANISFVNIMGLMGVLTIKSKIPSSAIYFESSSEGNFTHRGLNRRSRFIWEKDETLLAKLNLKFDRLTFRRKIIVESRSLIIVTLSAGCLSGSVGKCGTRKEIPGNSGMVMTRISINGKESARDNTVFNQSFPFPIYSSSMSMGMLEPGEYPLQAEGIFTGNAGDQKANIAVMIIQYSDLSYKQLMTLRDNGHKTIVNDFMDTGKLKPAQSIKKQIQVENLKKVTHTSSITKQG